MKQGFLALTGIRPASTRQKNGKARISAAATSTYEAISSVWEGTDGELLEGMFAFYATIDPDPILDATFNAGRFWKDSERQVVSMDIDARHKPMIVGDNRRMAGVPAAHFGTVVYDPPHVGPQGRDKSRKKFDVDFGATVECGKEQNWNLSYLYPPFLQQAKRVLKPGGLLLAKITDMVNNHRSKWAHCDFMRMAEEAGFTVCDLIIKIRNGPMLSDKWKEAHQLCCKDPPVARERQVPALHVSERDVVSPCDLVDVLIEPAAQCPLALGQRSRSLAQID